MFGVFVNMKIFKYMVIFVFGIIFGTAFGGLTRYFNSLPRIAIAKQRRDVKNLFKEIHKLQARLQFCGPCGETEVEGDEF